MCGEMSPASLTVELKLSGNQSVDKLVERGVLGTVLDNVSVSSSNPLCVTCWIQRGNAGPGYRIWTESGHSINVCDKDVEDEDDDFSCGCGTRDVYRKEVSLG